MEEYEIYSAIGMEGFDRLTTHFYNQIPADDILGPMYPAQDLEGARLRLRDFLIFRFGGPQTYIEQRGHPRLRMRHARFEVNPSARDRWVELMTRAISQSELPADAAQILKNFFESTATFLINR